MGDVIILDRTPHPMFKGKTQNRMQNRSDNMRTTTSKCESCGNPSGLKGKVLTALIPLAPPRPIQLCAHCANSRLAHASEPVLVDCTPEQALSLPTVFAGGAVREIFRNLVTEQRTVRAWSPPPSAPPSVTPIRPVPAPPVAPTLPTAEDGLI